MLELRALHLQIQGIQKITQKERFPIRPSDGEVRLAIGLPFLGAVYSGSRTRSEGLKRKEGA